MKHANRTTTQVTAYGSDNRYCTIQNWWRAGSGGTDVYVRCVDAAGMRANAAFTLAYLTNDQILY